MLFMLFGGVGSTAVVLVSINPFLMEYLFREMSQLYGTLLGKMTKCGIPYILKMTSPKPVIPAFRRDR